jgi:hypothetical protein
VTDELPFDVTVAHPARIWDYWLGGKDNFESDRLAAEEVMRVLPAIVQVARAGRLFLASSVRYLAAEAGIRQFLDIGTGLPTANNTHEVAQSIAPDSRIVYVDNDPIVLSHARALLTSSPGGSCAYVDADARDTREIIAEAGQTLDFSQPVAVMMLAIVHFIPDADDPRGLISRTMDAVPSGSYLVLSHGASDFGDETVSAGVQRYNQHSATPIRARSRAEVSRFFDGLELVPPGVVALGTWAPGAATANGGLATYTAVARKP